MKFTHKILALSLLMVSGFAFAAQDPILPVEHVFTTAEGKTEFLRDAKNRLLNAADRGEIEGTYKELMMEVIGSAAVDQVKANLLRSLAEMRAEVIDRIENPGNNLNNLSNLNPQSNNLNNLSNLNPQNQAADPLETTYEKMRRIAKAQKAKAENVYAQHPTAVKGTSIAGGVALTGAGLVAAYKKSPKVKENVDAAAKYTKEKAVIASDWAAKKAAAAKDAVVAKFNQFENTPISRADAIIATGTVALGVGAYKCLPSLATTQSAARTSFGYAKNHAKNAGTWVSDTGVAISGNEKVAKAIKHVQDNKVVYGSAAVVATTSALGYAAYRYITAPKKATIVPKKATKAVTVQVIEEEKEIVEVQVVEVVPNY